VSADADGPDLSDLVEEIVDFATTGAFSCSEAALRHEPKSCFDPSEVVEEVEVPLLAELEETCGATKEESGEETEVAIREVG
jgi:hypothetical protein